MASGKISGIGVLDLDAVIGSETSKTHAKRVTNALAHELGLGPQDKSEIREISRIVGQKIKRRKKLRSRRLHHAGH